MAVQSDSAHLQWRLRVTDGVIETEGIAGRSFVVILLYSFFMWEFACQGWIKQSKAAGKWPFNSYLKQVLSWYGDIPVSLMAIGCNLIV
jgi:hypothetical protein